MAGEKTVAPTNGMQNILSLLQTIAGTETKTTSTANIGPLQSVMDQIAASQGTQGQQLLESIFAQAAGAVPGIMGNTFNASGSRAPNNVMAGTLQKLMADVTKQAQAQIVQQQQNAQQMQLNAATQIANATRGQRQVQKSGASDFITKAGKVLTANKAIKGLTGKDYVQKAADAIKSAFIDDVGGGAGTGLRVSPAALAGTGYGLTAPMSATGAGLVLGDTNPFSALAEQLTAAAAPESQYSLTSQPVSTATSEAPNITVLPPVDYSFGNLTAGATGDGLSMLGGTPSGGTSSSFDLSGGQNFSGGEGLRAAPFTGDSTGYSLSDPSSAGAGGDSGSAASSAATFLKAYSYAKDPDKRKDIFDFSDGDFADDAGDIADVVAFAFPLAALVRPALTLADEAEDTVKMMAKDPYKWASNLVQGDDPLLKGVWDYAGGAIGGTWDAIADLGSDAGDFVGGAVEEVGDFFGDVFGW